MKKSGVFSKVIVIGLDGLEPSIVEPLLAAGELPHLARLRAAGGYTRIATTCPAQTPVAWSTFATGTNPGGHGIFDFIRRDPATYTPDFSLNRHEQKNPFVPPKAVNLRKGTPVWTVLSHAGVESVVLRCPCTYPAESLRGRMLSGMGVPDLRGGLGTGTFYTSSNDGVAGESEQLVRLTVRDGVARTHVVGPRQPRTRADICAEINVELQPGAGRVLVKSDGNPAVLEVRAGRWSDWLKVKFRVGMLQDVRGAVRFHLTQLEPELELYASPVNFDANAPLFPISEPASYAAELERAIGPFYTTGMVEDHGALSNGRISEEAYLDQCEQVLRERERMMLHELARLQEGFFFFCLFDTPDRVQHMLWRFREPTHPANHGEPLNGLTGAIEDHYRRCDAVVGRAMAHADDRTLAIVLSDHGFGSFRRGVHLNTWLHDQGLLTLKPGASPGDTDDFLQNVDWNRTKAYALGIGSVYLNLRGREANGIVTAWEAPAVTSAIVNGLTGLVDPHGGAVAVHGVSERKAVYSGPYAEQSPDLIVRFAAGYRASWSTALGGVPAGYFEDNTKKWGGDHIVDPALVPGVLFINRPFHAEAALTDLAPTILATFGIPPLPAMEGRSLL